MGLSHHQRRQRSSMFEHPAELKPEEKEPNLQGCKIGGEPEEAESSLGGCRAALGRIR